MISRTFLSAIAVVTMLLLDSCQSRECADNSERNQPVAAKDYSQRLLESARTIPADRNRDVLALSAGGVHGAFGAGFLSGLSFAGGGDGLPEYGVVTGVSAGSIMATHAFLGTREDLEELSRFWINITNDTVFEERFLLTALFSDSLRSTTPLRSLLTAAIRKGNLIERVAREPAYRKLFVGAVNLDTGVFHPFDLTALARSNLDAEEKLERYVDLVMASAAVPVVFPPIVLPKNHDGELNNPAGLYVDGGARHWAFLIQMLDVLEESAPSNRSPTVYVVMNQSLAFNEECVQPNLRDITSRSLGVVLNESKIGTLYRVFVHAKNFRAVWVPEGHKCGAPPQGFVKFDPVFQKCIHDVGKELGLNGSDAWCLRPPGMPCK